MQKIQNMMGSAAVLTLLLYALPTAVQAQQPGRAGRAPDPSLPLVQEAFKMTDPRYLISFSRYCMLNGPATANGKGDAAIPSQLFDNLYYVGRTDVGAWVLKTSDGLVLFDTLNNADEAANIIVPGMRKLGLDPDQIKLVVLTHFHNDHTGGMPYFRAKGVRMMASEVDWGQLGGVPNPESVIHDGQVVKFGDTSITLVLIPGHTPGTVAAVFPVFDHGQRHVAALTGGIGPTGGLEMHQTVIGSLAHLATVTKQAGVDVLLDPHEAIVDSTAWGYIMRPAERKPNQNDLIVGADSFQRFTQMLSTCMKARVVMYQQEKASAGAPR
ncbi:MAG: MBL fold metallo-hydrolase [Bryobacteraceae bacterium]|jgi:metallo-beta-lactamase class B